MKRIEIVNNGDDISIEFWNNGELDEILERKSAPSGMQNQIFSELKVAAQKALTSCKMDLFICDIIRKGKKMRCFLIAAENTEEAENMMHYDNEAAKVLSEPPFFNNGDSLSLRKVDPSVNIVKI
jgi:hypothetical protein